MFSKFWLMHTCDHFFFKINSNFFFKKLFPFLCSYGISSHRFLACVCHTKSLIVFSWSKWVKCDKNQLRGGITRVGISSHVFINGSIWVLLHHLSNQPNLLKVDLAFIISLVKRRLLLKYHIFHNHIWHAD